MGCSATFYDCMRMCEIAQHLSHSAAKKQPHILKPKHHIYQY